MKRIHTFESFLNEIVSKANVNRLGYYLSIEKIGSAFHITQSNGKNEVMFSADARTVNAVISALEEKKSPADKDMWTAIESKDGDIYIEKKKGTNVIVITQTEDKPDPMETVKFTVDEIDAVIEGLK